MERNQDYDEKCWRCRTEREHSEDQHIKAIQAENKRINKIEDALYRCARVQYDRA